MKYFIIGANGSIGSELIPTLVKLGHQVSGLVRSDDSAKHIRALGAKAVIGDIYTPDKWINEAAQANVLVQLGAVVPPKKSNNKWLQMGVSLNSAACEGLIEAAERGGNCKAFITSSGVSVVGDYGEEWITESTPKIETPLTIYWGPNEEYVFKARQKGINAISFRFGQIYGSNPNGTFAKFFLKMAEKKQFRYMGKGDNFFPFVHIKDAVDAIIKAGDNPNNEPILHIVDDRPIRLKESVTALLAAFDQKAKSVPIWLARIIAGKPVVKGFSGSSRMKNDLARKSLDWKPQYPSFIDEIENVVREYQQLVLSQK